jgi:hypothetical protein
MSLSMVAAVYLLSCKGWFLQQPVGGSNEAIVVDMHASLQIYWVLVDAKRT